MPYDDSDVKKMIRYQLERKVGFSQRKKISDEVKHLIHSLLEANVDLRYTVSQIKKSPWLHAAYQSLWSNVSSASGTSTTVDRGSVHAQASGLTDAGQDSSIIAPRLRRASVEKKEEKTTRAKSRTRWKKQNTDRPALEDDVRSK